MSRVVVFTTVVEKSRHRHFHVPGFLTFVTRHNSGLIIFTFLFLSSSSGCTLKSRATS